MPKTINCDCPHDAHEHLETCVSECAYCGCEEPSNDAEIVPTVDDEGAWADRARNHADDCEWILTRSHRRGTSYHVIQTASGAAVVRPDGAQAEFLGTREAEEALRLLATGENFEKDYEWSER